MKTITIEIKVQVPDDYGHCDDAEWIIDDILDPRIPLQWEKAAVIEN